MNPSPDWKGGVAVAVVGERGLCPSRTPGNEAGRRNPGKRDKLPSVAFYPASFMAKTCLFLLLTNDAPSMALLVLLDKMLRRLDGSVRPDTVEKAVCSRL